MRAEERICHPVGPPMERARKVAVASLLQRYCDARNAACLDELPDLLGMCPVFDSQRFNLPIEGREAVLAHLEMGWRYLRSLQDPLAGGSYRVREVSIAEAADAPCGVLHRRDRDEHLCIVEPDLDGRIGRIRLLYFPDPAITRKLWLGIQPAWGRDARAKLSVAR